MILTKLIPIDIGDLSKEMLDQIGSLGQYETYKVYADAESLRNSISRYGIDEVLSQRRFTNEPFIRQLHVGEVI